MAERFRGPRYGDDALTAFRTLVAEYPSSSLGEEALWSAVEVARESQERRKLVEAARAYLETYPEGSRAGSAKRLLREREPASPLPRTPPPGLARVFDLRAWSGEASTRVVVDVERSVRIQSDRAYAPDRLWVDLVGTRLHPNLAKRSFPVGDGLLEQVRVAQNRDDVVRVVLDFKEVSEHQVFFLEDPARLVIDVRGRGAPRSRIAAGPAPDARSAPAPGPDDGRRAAPSHAARRGHAAARPRVRAQGADHHRGRRHAADAARGPAPHGISAPPAPAPPPSAPLPTPEAPLANRAGNYSLARQLGLGARRIVIDAGHGGHDPGTIGPRGLQEKDVVLDVALRLERLVRQELRTEVVLTRSSDVFIPLEERTAIANSKGADLFVSIHANASRSASARGIETYFLSFARTPHAEAVAARENAISTATLKDLQNLVKAITLNSKLDESRDLAASIQESMVSAVREKHPVPDRGVHSAPFYVLIGANMPAILAELAFVSHPEDEKRLRTPEYREVLGAQPAARVGHVPRGARPYPGAPIDRLRPPAYSGRRAMISARLLAAEPAVTWIKVEKQTFDLVGVVLGSFHLAGILLLGAFALGLLLGAALLRSRRRPRPTPIESVSLHLDARG